MERATGSIGATHGDQDWEAIRTHQRGVPDKDAPPVMTDKNGLLLTERVEQAHQIPNQMEQRIDSGIGGLVGLAVSPQIRDDDMVASLSQRGHLIPPGVPQFREAVTEQHKRTGSLLRNMHA
jgi:hypothetical protein